MNQPEPLKPVVIPVDHPLITKADDGAPVYRAGGLPVFNPRHPEQGVIWTTRA